MQFWDPPVIWAPAAVRNSSQDFWSMPGSEVSRRESLRIWNRGGSLENFEVNKCSQKNIFLFQMFHLNASMQNLVKATVGICKLFEAETRL